MREVDDAAQVEDERQPERHQHVEGADDEPVRDVEQQKLGHGAGRGGSLRGKGEALASLAHAGHCTLQPVASSGGAVLSPGTTSLTLNRSSGSLAPLGTTSPTKAEVMSWWSPLR